MPSEWYSVSHTDRGTVTEVVLPQERQSPNPLLFGFAGAASRW